MPRERRLTFGEVAELYDRARPTYPAELVREVIELAGVEPRQRVLEVGAGTGKATAMFAARGLPVIALEPSAAMATIARRTCAPYPEVEIVQSDFERWDAGMTFPLLYCAQAWHWIEPELRYLRARAVLSPDGLLAVFWNRASWEECELRDELRVAYRSAAPEFGVDGPMHPGFDLPLQPSGDWAREIDATTGFDRPEVRHYKWTCVYSTSDYAELLQTHSDHVLLAPERLQALLGAVGDVIDRHGGRMQFTYVTLLCLARAAERNRATEGRAGGA